MSIEGTICLFAILEVLKCAENQEYCDGIRKINYSRPILMQVSNLSLKLYLYYILTCDDFATAAFLNGNQLRPRYYSAQL